MVRSKMTSERRVCLQLADVKRYGVPCSFWRRDAKSAGAKGCVAEQKVSYSDIVGDRQMLGNV